MRRLVELIDTMRNFGYLVAVPGGRDTNGMPSITIEPPREIEWGIFAKVQPFVFSNTGALDITFRAKQIQKNWREGLAEADVDAPFPVWSIEHVDGTALDYFYDPDGHRRETLCIMVVEVAPKQYGYYTLTQDPDSPFNRVVAWKSNAETSTVEHFMERLSREKMGTESTRINIRMGTGKSKYEHKIRKIIHVTAKKDVPHYKAERQVDWSHRWEVRGHWVKLPGGIGKDRSGNYCVADWTWRDHHVKGPKHLPLIKKVRVVTDE